MKALLGKKIGMSRVFSSDGEAVPVTLIFAEPNLITLRRHKDKDGQAAVQLALPRSRKSTKDDRAKGAVDFALRGKPNQLRRLYAARREFPIEVGEDVQSVAVDQFEVGDVVEVTAVSKGKGFAGVVKRHHFKGGPASHGHRHVLRRPGSIGSRFPQHVLKGVRMAGRMGADRVTVKNLVIMQVDKEKNLLAIKGAVPGRRGTIVEVRTRT